MPDRLTFSSTTLQPIAISQDGRRVVLQAEEVEAGRNSSRFYIRAIDRFDLTPIPHAAGRFGSLFPSPDGEWIGTHRGLGSDSAIVKVQVDTGRTVTLAKTPVSQYAGASWGKSGSIVFSFEGGRGGLRHVSEDGGPVGSLTNPLEGEHHLHPHIMPDGRLLFVRRRDGLPGRIAVLDPSNGGIRELLHGTSPGSPPTRSLAGPKIPAPFARPRLWRA